VWQHVVRPEKELGDYLLYWYTNVLVLLETESGARKGTLILLALLVQTHVVYEYNSANYYRRGPHLLDYLFY
jgi:hypothetical protein